jgi:hypothetical protein
MSNCRYYIGTFRLKDDESSDIWHDQIMRDQMGPILDDAFKYGATITEERSVPSDFDMLHCHLYAKFKNDKKAMLFVLKYPQVRRSERIKREDYAKNLNWIA